MHISNDGIGVDFVCLAWEPPQDLDPPTIELYYLKFGLKGSLPDEPNHSSSSTNKRFDDLEEGKEYEVQVAAKNSFGVGQFTPKLPIGLLGKCNIILS